MPKRIRKTRPPRRIGKSMDYKPDVAESLRIYHKVAGMKDAPPTGFPKRIRKSGEDKPMPNMLKVALKRPQYTQNKENYLVPYGKRPTHPAYRKVFMAPDQTLYIVNRQSHQIVGLMTEYANGLLVAWSGCGRCHYHWSRCRCPSGVTAPRSIEYIGDKIHAEMKGEEWGVNHPNYMGSLRKAEREAAEEARMRRLYPATADPLPVTHKDAPKRLRKGSGASHGVPAPTQPRRLGKHAVNTESASDVVTSSGVDSQRLDTAAQKSADSLSALVKKQAEGAGSTPKRLKKGGQ